MLICDEIITRPPGVTILYKTKFKAVVALSFKEAEFISAGKNSFYLRSIHEEMKFQQHEANIYRNIYIQK